MDGGGWEVGFGERNQTPRGFESPNIQVTKSRMGKRHKDSNFGVRMDNVQIHLYHPS